jgi:hypothetical protein
MTVQRCQYLKTPIKANVIAVEASVHGLRQQSLIFRIYGYTFTFQPTQKSFLPIVLEFTALEKYCIKLNNNLIPYLGPSSVNATGLILGG